MPPIIALPTLLLLGAGFVTGAGMLLRSRRGLSTPECFAAAWTALFWLLTATALLLGFTRLFRKEIFFAVLVVADVALIWMVRRTSTGKPLAATRGDIARWVASLDSPACTALTLGIVSALFFLLLGLRLPPVDYDGLSYHLGMALHILQDGDFRLYPGESGYVNYFSRGTELIGALLIGCAGTIDIVNSVQWLVLPALIPSVYAAGRGFGLARSRATIGAMLPLAVPVILYQTTITYADLWSLGWWMVSACALFGAASRSGPVLERVSRARVIWFFLAGGLAMAAKFNAAQPLALLGIASFLLWGWRPMLAPCRLPVALAGFLAAAAIGLPWAARNWIVVGTPIYPWELKIAGHVIAPGPFPYETIRLVPEGEEYSKLPLLEKAKRSWTAIDIESWRRLTPYLGKLDQAPKAELFRADYGYRGDNKLGGWGLAWLVLYLPAMLLLAALALVLPRWPGAPPRRYWIALAVLPLAAYAIIVASWWTRFALFLPVFGGLAYLVLVEASARRVPALSKAMLFILALVAGFDWLTCVALNRDWARAAQFRREAPNATAAPIDYFVWADAKSSEYLAIQKLIRLAHDGDAISFHTPEVPTFSGYFTNARGTLRLVPFPTVWPRPDSLTQAQMLNILAKEHVAWLLLGPTSPAAFREAVEAAGWREVDREGKFAIMGLSGS